MSSPPEQPRIPRDDAVRLEHMLQACREIVTFVAQGSRERMDNDALFRRAMIHAVQEIGEAASRVGEPTRSLLPTVPWQRIRRTRNIVVHVYHGVDHDIIWEVATIHVAGLTRDIEAFLLNAVIDS